jgi:hypothetical protein
MSMLATMTADFDNAKKHATSVNDDKHNMGKSETLIGQQSTNLHNDLSSSVGLPDVARVPYIEQFAALNPRIPFALR